MREDNLRAFAFGGTPRGVFDFGEKYSPRDLDIVVDDGDFDCFQERYRQYIVRKNRFGGLNLNYEWLSIDAWPIGSTWAFKEGLIKKKSFETLPHTTFLNVDGLVIELWADKGRPRTIHDAGFFAAWRTKTLDLNLEANPFPALCIARTLNFALRFRFFFSKRICKVLEDLFQNVTVPEIIAAQISHYGKIYFDETSLKILRSRLNRSLECSAEMRISLFPSWPEQLEFSINDFNRAPFAMDKEEDFGSEIGQNHYH